MKLLFRCLFFKISWSPDLDPTCRLHSLNASRSLSPTRCYLLLGDLHVQDEIVNQLRQGLLDSAFEFAIFQESMDKFKNAKDEIFKAQDFAYRKHTREAFNNKKAKGKHRCWKGTTSSL